MKIMKSAHDHFPRAPWGLRSSIHFFMFKLRVMSEFSTVFLGIFALLGPIKSGSSGSRGVAERRDEAPDIAAETDVADEEAYDEGSDEVSDEGLVERKYGSRKESTSSDEIVAVSS
jgi:hypothetical protein